MRSWAEACVTTTTKTSSTRQQANATSTALSVTCRACWERRHKRSWPVWTFCLRAQSRGSAPWCRQRRSTAAKRGGHSRKRGPGLLNRVLQAAKPTHLYKPWFSLKWGDDVMSGSQFTNVGVNNQNSSCSMSLKTEYHVFINNKSPDPEA